VHAIPLRGGTVVVWLSPYAPFFGREEMSMLERIGALGDLARERCALIEHQRTFIANAAHELRTPLTTILGLSSTLARRGTELPAKQLEECLGAIARQGERARGLIENLLDLAQLDAERASLSMMAVPLSDATRRALHAAPPPEGSLVEVRIDDALRAAADPERLEQILVNLLTNAYRYGAPPIRIDARAEDASVVLAVTDHGPGVPDALLPTLFEPFTRAPNGPPLGSGLGLTISKRLAEALGGTMWCEPAGARGARFHVRLRRAA
jgi:two-component system sensor histidine kinase MtrB